MSRFIARVAILCFIALLATSTSLLAEWQVNGSNLIPSSTSHATYPKACPDGQGGAIVAWVDYAGAISMCAQRIDGRGNLLWADKVSLTAPADQYNHRIIADGNGGAIVVWEDRRGATGLDVYAQKVNAAGVVQWDPSGVPVCTAAADQTQIVIVSDQRGGAIIL